MLWAFAQLTSPYFSAYVIPERIARQYYVCLVMRLGLTYFRLAVEDEDYNTASLLVQFSPIPQRDNVKGRSLQ